VSRPSLKRKPSESLQDETITTSDPFSGIKIPARKRPNTNEVVNPFAVLTIPKREKTTSGTALTEKNPFSDIKNLIKPPEPKLVKIEQDLENIPPESSVSRRRVEACTTSNTTRNTTTSSIVNASWKSKSTISSQVMIKEEDPDLAAISKAFKGCVSIIVFKPSVKTRIVSQMLTPDGRKNFKKFKKVILVHRGEIVG